MTSLIFGSIWLGHKGFVKYKRDKQRQKNYERWEGLRDEYDEQRKITRESRSLDIQRTGSSYVTHADADRPILTLRDQQEANDARTSWRPQEAWDGPISPAARRVSVEVTGGSGLRPIAHHKTGATWDEDLPQPLPVRRRNWEDHPTPSVSGNVSRSSSIKHNNSANGMHPAGEFNTRSNTPAASASQTTSPRAAPVLPNSTPHSRSVSAFSGYLQEGIEPIESSIPGGKMAELIEMGDSSAQSHQPSPFSSPPLQPFANPPQQPYTGFQPGNNPFTTPAPTVQPFGQAAPAQQPIPQPLAQPLAQPISPIFQPISQPTAPTFPPISQPIAPTFPPVSQPISPTFPPVSQPISPTFPPSTSQLAAQPFGQPVTQSHPGGMEEWWNRP